VKNKTNGIPNVKVEKNLLHVQVDVDLETDVVIFGINVVEKIGKVVAVVTKELVFIRTNGILNV